MEPISLMQQKTQVRVNEFIRSVYNWMFIGLGLTGLVSLYVSGNESLLRLIYGNQLLFFGLIIAELALVFSISGMVNRMSAGTATALFVVYSGLNGVTLSFIFLVYTRASIVSTFFICAVTFLAGFLFMGLIGIIIASVVNMFIHSSAVSVIVSYIGVIVFVGLTAYDTQRMKNMALTQPDGLGSAVIRKGAILGALSLYLDFINLFLMLLRIFGQARD